MAQLLQGGGGVTGGKPMMPGMPGGPATPPPMEAMGSPMSTPQPAAGDMAAAQVQIGMAMDMLEKSLYAFGSESQEGQSILSALQTLTKKFGEARSNTKELIPEEMRQLLQGMKPSPVAQAMQQAAPPMPPMPH